MEAAIKQAGGRKRQRLNQVGFLDLGRWTKEMCICFLDEAKDKGQSGRMRRQSGAGLRLLLLMIYCISQSKYCDKALLQNTTASKWY